MNAFLSQITGLLPVLASLLVIYFIVLRPQQQKAQKLKEALGGLKRGDKVLLSGGILGEIKIAQANQDEVHVEIAQGVVVRVRRSAVTEVLQ